MSRRATGWAKLSLELEQLVEPVAIESDTGPVALAYWTALLIEAKSSERFGYVETTAKRFARRVFETRARPTLWQAFVDEGLIELVEGEFAGRFVVKMHDEFFDEQTPAPKSDADRARESRKRRNTASNRGERHASGVTDVAEKDAPSRSTSHETRAIDSRQRDVPPNGGSAKPRRVARLSPAQVTEQIEACREKLNGLSPLVDQLVDALAGENKTGQVAESRVLRELWQPIAAMSEELERGALRHGLEAAVGASAPNARYVKKAAGSYRPQTRPVRGGDIIEGANDGQQQQLGGQYAHADLTW